MKTEEILKLTGNHLKHMLEKMKQGDGMPRSINNDRSIRYVSPRDWTSGFFPGCLWLQYEHTGDPWWREKAEEYTEILESEQFDDSNHDIGFKMYCSYGAGFRLNGDRSYREILLQSAKTLCSRFNPTTGCIQSWNKRFDWDYPVIIDNMMNLELLFWASRESGDPVFADIATSHARTTQSNHFRSDKSCYHVLNYNTSTGEVIHKHNYQGYDHESAWARGQAWAVYGYTMCYRETGDHSFLEQAVKTADFVISHKNLPEDGVPYWDFDDPSIPDAPRDASAGAVLASGLYEMQDYLNEEGIPYREFADKILASLCSPAYLAAPGENHNFILKHSTGNLNRDDEVDKPLIYADYYFLEAVLRKARLGKN